MIDTLKVLTTPYLPFSAERVHTMLGFAPGDDANGTWSGRGHRGTIAVPAAANWAIGTVPAGQALRQPEPLFIKLDPQMAEEELARLETGRVAKT